MKNLHISLLSEPEPIPYPEDWRERLGGMNLKQQKAWSDGFNACRNARQLKPAPAVTVQEAARVLLDLDENETRKSVYEACEKRIKVYVFDKVLRAIAGGGSE